MPYYVIEGQDATGKTTQAQMLAEYLQAQGREVLVVEEPSQHSLPARVLRRLLKGKKYNLSPAVQVLLFTASRVMLWDDVVQPALDAGVTVVASRNWFSTMAYQCGEGVSMRQVVDLTRSWTPLGYRNPDGVVILTLDEETRQQRQEARDDTSSQDAFESQGADYQERVNLNYEEVARAQGVAMVTVTSPEETQQGIREVLGV